MGKKKRHISSDNTFEKITADLTDSQIEDLSTEVISLDNPLVKTVQDHTREILNFIVEFKELMMMYNCAIKEIKTKFEVLDMEFKTRHQRNPINFIKTRLKSTSSIVEKMRRKNIPFTLENSKNILTMLPASG